MVLVDDHIITNLPGLSVSVQSFPYLSLTKLTPLNSSPTSPTTAQMPPHQPARGLPIYYPSTERPSSTSLNKLRANERYSSSSSRLGLSMGSTLFSLLLRQYVSHYITLRQQLPLTSSLRYSNSTNDVG